MRTNSTPLGVTIFLICLPFLATSLRQNSGVSDPWGENHRPKLYTDYLTQHSDAAYRFFGNHTHADYFKLLKRDGQSLLIGARNVIYNISLPYLTENVEQRITWDPLQQDRELCHLKGKNEVDCQNYIRVLAKTQNGQLLVCGTNAYNPKCREYSHNSTHSSFDREFSGKGFCPYDPRHNSTFLYADGELYSGTVADFSASDSLIIKDSNLRTEQYDFKQLNAPDFVNALEDDDHVYFFFREAAVEHINCGKTTFSRIARVCKRDTGGPHKFKHKWTTFLKTRLNCSVPGDTPFYFNDIQATTSFIRDGQIDQVVYGVFTTPDNSISGSAICAFKLSDIQSSFEHGPFKNQENSNSNWLPMSKSQIPEPRPGLCSVEGQSLPEKNLNFIKRHSLMDQAVKGATKAPIFTKTSIGERLTVIEADPGVMSVERTVDDVLFVGTTHGRVLKVSANTNTLIESLQVFPYHIPVRNLLVTEDQIIVLSDHEVNAFPLQRCSSSKSCGDCVALQDPYCAWDLVLDACVDHRSSRSPFTNLIQDLEHGYHAGCPLPKPETSSTTTTSTSTTTTSSSEAPSTSQSSSTSAPVTKRVTVNSPAHTPEDNSTCQNCNCPCASSNEPTEDNLQQSTESSGALFPTIVPYYEENSLDTQQRDNKELNLYFEGPYSNGNGDSEPHEAANSSPHYKESRQRTYSEQTLSLSIVLTALLALIVGFSLGLLASKRCKDQQKLPEIYDKTLNFTNRAAHIMRGVGQRCSFYHQNRPHPPVASSASSTSSGSGCSPPSSVHLGQLDSGYTTPSNLTSASVATQETCSSTASSTPSNGATPAASPNTTLSETLRNYSTMPHNYQRQFSGLAVMGTTGGTLQKVKRVYL